MGKIERYRNNGPDWVNLSLLDLIFAMDKSKTNKYVPMMMNVMSNDLLRRYNQEEINDIRREIEAREIFPEGFITNMSTLALIVSWRIFDAFNYNDLRTIKEFINFCEDNNFKGLDTTKITTLDEMTDYIALASIKKDLKEYEKQVVKEYEDEEWMVIRPLTWESSLKYGAASKWCTASKDNPEHFFRYTKEGSLIYFINKVTGYKVAWHFNIKERYETKSSFWDVKDSRTDVLETKLPINLIMWVRSMIIDNNIKSNKEVGLDVWLESYKRVKKEMKVHELNSDVGEMDMVAEAEVVGEPMTNEYIEERYTEVPVPLNRLVQRLRDLDLPVEG